MPRFLAICYSEGKRIVEPPPEAREAVKKGLGEAIAKRPGVKFAGVFYDPATKIGIADWEAPDAKSVEGVLNELQLPFDVVIPVVPLEL